MSALEYEHEDLKIVLSHAARSSEDAAIQCMCGGIGEYSIGIASHGLYIVRVADEEPVPVLPPSIPVEPEPLAITSEIPTVKKTIRRIVQQRAATLYTSNRHKKGGGHTSATDNTIGHKTTYKGHNK